MKGVAILLLLALSAVIAWDKEKDIDIEEIPSSAKVWMSPYHKLVFTLKSLTQRVADLEAKSGQCSQDLEDLKEDMMIHSNEVYSNLTQQISDLDAQMHSADEQLNSDVSCLKNSLSDGTEYTVSSNKMNWTDARSYCQNLGGDLIVNGLQDWDQRIQVLDSLGITESDGKLPGSYWIGLHELSQEGQWEWITTPKHGTDMHWASGEPNNANGGEACAEIRVNHHKMTNDDPCRIEKYAICEHMVNLC